MPPVEEPAPSAKAPAGSSFSAPAWSIRPSTASSTTTRKKSAALPSAWASTASPCSNTRSTTFRFFFKTASASSANSHDDPANRIILIFWGSRPGSTVMCPNSRRSCNSVISNGAGRCFSLHVRSCERLGLRKEISSPRVVVRAEKSLFALACPSNLELLRRFFFNTHESPATSREIMTFADATKRFSNRVADYVRYRPGYPPGVRDLLRAECGLRHGHVVADIGSGTGFLSELFLRNGNRVFGVEPNQAMREAGEEYLASYDGFTSVNGSAEATTLEPASVDFVTAGQAFHWFDRDAARREFQRILKPDGWLVVVWNERLVEASSFVREYENLLRNFGTDYERVKENYPTEVHMREFFSPNQYRAYQLPNSQEFDL